MTTATRMATRELALIEAGRMLRHPGLWAGIAVSVLMARSVWEEDWSGQRYTGLVASATPLLLGISLASISAFGRELLPLAEEAPLDRPHRAAARLLGGLPLVVVAAVLTGGVAVFLRVTGGMTLGDEPGHTSHAHYTLPELLQPVLLAGLAVAIGAATVHLVRRRLAAALVLGVLWFVSGPSYWVVNGPVVTWLTPLQVQPSQVEVGPAATDPTTFPAGWLLTGPGEYQDHWARVVVSPWVALGHDVYLIGLISLAVAAAVPGRTRVPLALGGLLTAVVGVTVQWAVAP